MFIRPKFKTSFDVHALKGKYLFLLNERQQIILQGPVYAELAAYLDGKRSIAEIAGGLGGRVSLPMIYYALGQLEKLGYITEGENYTDRPQNSFIEHFNGEGRSAAVRRDSVSFAVQAIGNVSRELMIESLRANGLKADEEGDFLIVVTDDYLRPELERINREAISRGSPWMILKPVGMVLWLGPIFMPGETGCWQCLAQRQRSNRQMEQFIIDRRKKSDPVITSRSFLPSTLELACNLAAIEISKWLIAPGRSLLSGKLVSVDLYSRKSRDHLLVRRPQCPACGLPGNRAGSPAPIRMVSRKKRFMGDGGHRIFTPEETLERYKYHISPILGAVTMLLPAFGRKSELTPSYVAGHNFSMGLESIVFLQESLRGMSGGKGSTDGQAKASGLCEAIERYSGLYNGDEYVVRGSYAALKPAAIHPNDCMGFSERQFQQRVEWNSSHALSRCVLIPNPFDGNEEIDWTPLYSLTREEFRYLPTAFCYYGHPEFREPRWCTPDSNGAAAGNAFEEAFLQGFMEVVERDAVALWWYNRIRRRAVDLDSFRMPYVDAIREYYRSLNREMWVLDITSDLKITTFACISRRTDRTVEDVVLGFGAHFDPRIALLRAITEANQFLPSVSTSNPDGGTCYLFGGQLAREWWTTATVAENDYLMPAEGERLAGCSDFDNPSSDDLLDDIELCLRIARQNSLEVLVLDQTRPDIGLNVVKVVVPQLCHFWRRLGKARLYETPVKQGWLGASLSEDQMNPWSIFF